MRLFSFLISLLVGLLICWKMPRFGISYGMFGKEKPFISLGIGFLVLFLTPLASLVSFTTFSPLLLGDVFLRFLLIFACLTSAFLWECSYSSAKNPSFGKCFGSYAAGAEHCSLLVRFHILVHFSFLVFALLLGVWFRSKRYVCGTSKRKKYSERSEFEIADQTHKTNALVILNSIQDPQDSGSKPRMTKK